MARNPGALGRIHRILGEDTSDNHFTSTNVASNADGTLLERLEYIQASLLAQMTPGVTTGTTDIDVSASDFTTVGGIPILTITPSVDISDVVVDLDLLKDTTGLLVVNSTETVQLHVQTKIDGTNWRTVSHWPAASSTTGIAVADAAQDLDALDDSPGHRFHIGAVGADEEVRITITLSAETGGDAEIPYAVYYRGTAPTITDVAAG